VRQLNAVLEREASTRSAALLRIGLAILIFTRYGALLVLDHRLDRISVWIVLAFWSSTTAMLFGYRAQWSTLTTALTLLAGRAYFGSLLHDGSWGSNHHVHLLIAATIGCALTPSGRSYSLDRWLALRRCDRRAEPPPLERGRVAALYLIALQLSAVYFWGAVNKTTWGWLSGAKLESQLLDFIFDSDPPDLPGWHLMVAAFAIGTLLLEYALAFGLWLPSARRWLIPIGIAFHIAIYVTLPVSIFSALSCLLYLTYLDPDDVHALIERLSGARA
jgi:hypothetical protein